MSDENNSDPVIGDGVITFPDGEPEMPVQLGDALSELLLGETAGNIQADNRRGRDTTTLASGFLQAGMAKQFNEIGPVESRAVSGVMATPVAAPTTS